MVTRYTVDFSPEAQDQIEERAVRIWREGYPLAAHKYGSEIYAYCREHLSIFPYGRIEIGQTSPNPDDRYPGLRKTTYKSTQITYAIDEAKKVVWVLEIAHVKEDFKPKVLKYPGQSSNE